MQEWAEWLCSIGVCKCCFSYVYFNTALVLLLSQRSLAVIVNQGGSWRPHKMVCAWFGFKELLHKSTFLHIHAYETGLFLISSGQTSVLQTWRSLRWYKAEKLQKCPWDKVQKIWVRRRQVWWRGHGDVPIPTLQDPMAWEQRILQAEILSQMLYWFINSWANQYKPAFVFINRCDFLFVSVTVMIKGTKPLGRWTWCNALWMWGGLAEQLEQKNIYIYIHQSEITLMNALAFHYLPPPSASEVWPVEWKGAGAVTLLREAPLSWSVKTSCVTKRVPIAGKDLGPISENDKRGRKQIASVSSEKDFICYPNILIPHTLCNLWLSSGSIERHPVKLTVLGHGITLFNSA